MTINFTEEDFKPISELKHFPPEHISVAGLYPYISRLKNDNGVMGVEIGTERGESAYLLLQAGSNIKKLFTIDPYETYSCWNGNIPQEICEKFEAIAKQNLEKFKDRVEMIKKRSVDAAKDFEESSLDFVYIDGLDSQEEQINDMNAWYSKLRLGGFFCGHNFQLETVREALKIFREQNRIRIPIQRTESFGWFWYKA